MFRVRCWVDAGAGVVGDGDGPSMIDSGCGVKELRRSLLGEVGGGGGVEG